MKHQLVVITGPERGLSIEIVDGQTLSIGRGADCQLQLNDPRCSRLHCRVDAGGGKVELADADSTSGTRVNGRPTDRCELNLGDVIGVGQSELRFQLAAAQDEATMMESSFGRPRPAPAVAPLERLVGQSFSHYELQDIIARGSSGMVYKARDADKDRTVAVKVLSPEYSGSDEQKERFVRGIKTMAPIRHDNIVRLYAAGIQDEYCWVAMEYVDGESLTQVIERIGVSGMLDWKLAFHVGVQIARALDEAAGHEIIHRNVTPQNILLRSNDNVAKLCDLTLAKALQGTLARQVTQPGELVGEVAYMSPERTRGQENVDGRSDIYGLGATLYALLTGHPPFRGVSLPEIIAGIRNDEPDKPKKFQLAIPDMFQDLILRMLAKQPEERYQTPGELLRDLERVGKFNGITL